MKHLDLFSGIGGFAYAIDQVWNNVEHTFCDNDLFCQQVLKKHWPTAKIYGDIRELTIKSFANTKNIGSRRFTSQECTVKKRIMVENKQEGRKVRSESKRCSSFDIVTGGFPCQPFSQAGKRRGTEDDRYLWPEMFRVIREFKPTWVVAENVAGLVTWNNGMVLEQVCLDLEAEGYEVQPFIIPAVSVNAPHRRDRIWIVANRTGKRSNQRKEKNNRFSQNKKTNRFTQEDNDVTNAQSQRWCDRSAGQQQQYTQSKKVLPGWNDTGNQQCDRGQDWSKNWPEVATELCGVDDGLPVELDRFKLSKAGHRNARLKALGNAIVPQVAIKIFEAINLNY